MWFFNIFRIIRFWYSSIKMPGTMLKESEPRKFPKCSRILLFWISPCLDQLFDTYWTFSQLRVTHLTWFLLQWFRHLEKQVMSTHNILFWNSTFLGLSPLIISWHSTLEGPLKIFSNAKNVFPNNLLYNDQHIAKTDNGIAKSSSFIYYNLC